MRALLFGVVVVLSGCGDDGAPGVDPDPPPPGSDAGGVTGGEDAGATMTTLPPTSRFLCDVEPPPGAPSPPPPPTYAGTCPTLAAGENTLTSSGNARELILLHPADMREDEQLPVFFFWHWLGGSANSFVERGELAQAVEEQRFIAVVPESKDDIFTKWPYSILDSDARVQEELQFFDDMYACVAEQFHVNPQCVVSSGVSAGALWTAQLAQARGEYLSSIIVLSGGTGGGTIRGWAPSEHRMPALVLWGGSGDRCVILSFEATSRDLEQNLTSDGHFVVECVHNCGHTVPPVDAPDGMSLFSPLWEFGFNHPYWLGDGESPYTESGLPGHFPEWCEIGMGGATPRTGMCESGSEC